MSKNKRSNPAPQTGNLLGSSTDINKNRRDLLKSAAAVTAAVALPGCGGSGGNAGSVPPGTVQPNILFILVDEMRYPKVFPTGVTNAAQYIQRFMPNVYRLWEGGVKFANHNAAATACSPSRGTLMTGLYSHQTWFATTLVIKPGSTTTVNPPLQSAFPTYGSVLSAAGYQTPYIGKWHCSNPTGPTQELYAYGFQGMTYPDPIANNLQGTYGDMDDPSFCYYNDAYIATQASTWLSNKKVGDKPWCLTVGFQNPHDQEFFPAGTEYQDFTANFANAAINTGNYAQNQNWSTAICATSTKLNYPNALVNPPIYPGYPATVPNWQTLAELQSGHQPSGHILNKQFCEVEWGGISETQGVTSFSINGYPGAATAFSGYIPPTTSSGQLIGIGYEPYSYWNKAINLYTFLQTILDKQVGQVLDGIPPDVLANTVVVFTSDHGDYNGAHGFVAGKTLSMYDEAIRVPLIVKDYTGTYTGDTDTVRPQLTSAIDLMPMLVGLGYGGQPSTWMQGDYKALYSKRYNMFPLLKSASTPGLDFALFATDEVVASSFDFVTAPTVDGQRTPVHILGVITPQYKLGVYSRWPLGTTAPSLDGQQYEYYDYSTTGGQMETVNTYYSTPAAQAIKDNLMNVLVPTILEEPLPATYRSAQATAKTGLVEFNALNQSSGRE